MLKTVSCPIYSASVNFPDCDAIFDGETAVSYKELNRAVSTVSSRLKFLGIKRGERVLIMSKNSYSFVVSLFALFRIGSVACPVNFRFPDVKVGKIAENCASGVILIGERDDVKLPGVKKLYLEEINLPPVVYNSMSRESPKIDVDADATIVMTSGSTGEDKAVLHTFGNHLFSALGSNENIKLCKGDKWLLSLPLFHVGGIAILFRVFSAGASIYISHSFSNATEMIINCGITHLSFVEAQLYDFVNYLENERENRIGKLKAVLVGGGPVNHRLLSEAIDIGIPIYSTYGMTEMSSQVTTSESRLTKADFDHSGKLLRFRELKIGSGGEIFVRGKTLCKGYVKNGHVDEFSPDYWFPTGDIGSIDENGNLHVNGRIDNMFISGGENIFPEEIEKEIVKIEGITDATVIPVKDSRFGGRPVAFLKVKDGFNPEKRVLTDYLKRNLPTFKIPDRFFREPKVEKSALKKNRKFFKEFLKNMSSLDEFL